MPENQEIDFMSIDVEGLDFEVLKSNDWDKFKPKMIAIEILQFDMNKLETYEIHKFLTEKDYRFYSRTIHTVFYERE